MKGMFKLAVAGFVWRWIQKQLRSRALRSEARRTRR